MIEVQDIAELSIKDLCFECVTDREVKAINVLSHDVHVAFEGTEGDERWESFGVSQMRRVKADSGNTWT